MPVVSGTASSRLQQRGVWWRQVAAGSLPLLKRLRKQSVDWCRGRIDEWKLFHYLEPVAFVLREALLHGHVAVVYWLMDEAGITLPHQHEEEQDGAGQPDGREVGFHDHTWREVALKPATRRRWVGSWPQEWRWS